MAFMVPESMMHSFRLGVRVFSPRRHDGMDLPPPNKIFAPAKCINRK